MQRTGFGSCTPRDAARGSRNELGANTCRSEPGTYDVKLFETGYQHRTKPSSIHAGFISKSERKSPFLQQRTLDGTNAADEIGMNHEEIKNALSRTQRGHSTTVDYNYHAQTPRTTLTSPQSRSPGPGHYEVRDADRNLSNSKSRLQPTGILHTPVPFSASAPRAVLMQMRTEPQPSPGTYNP